MAKQYYRHDNFETVRKTERKTDSQVSIQGESSSTTRTRARARARDALSQLIEDYETYVDQADRSILAMLTAAIRDGMETDVIRSAIRDTGMAPRPSKRYLRRILERYTAEGVLTVTDLIRDRDRHEARIQSLMRRRTAKWYDDDSHLTEYDRAVMDPFADEYNSNIDNFIPIQTDDYVRDRIDEILNS